eukprot:CAMPEP_0201998996 /NCGR_PEP_ID=MMETSP0905-20130828/5665_1 /ASSEMBLY_ACC=CAM_ASM_000554 /TAXON_ID=420261 /ORGANISM="Thalassiosira antarctica, Strain CCMP982" /LENGTH=416 /DNA_ID=CAMNT_0048555109 /DNA_START=17 /DNA_END=1264 /DNA_ORIENTATION=+
MMAPFPLLLSCCIALTFIPRIHGFSTPSTRRAALQQLQKISFTPFVTLLPPPPNAVAADAESTPISAAWNAVDGLNSLESEKKFVSFDKSAYDAMVNDKSRTPLFEQAIINRLKSAEPDSQVVLDLGTGPGAFFAVTAAKNGAKKVYAIEASKEAAASARDTVKKLGYEEKIIILEGFSTDITLPGGEKADFAIAEIVGSVASEEGAYATILDAHTRLLKNPTDPTSWIPNRIQTYAAPASYLLHNLFLPPAFDWTKLDGEPVRFNCKDEGLQLLSNPIVVEDISFADIGKGVQKKQTTFTVDGSRVEDNIKMFTAELNKGKMADAEKIATTTANSFTGIALWPRLTLDDTVQVNSRQYPSGGHQKSHWQTVLPIMAPEPVTVKGGDQITVSFDFDVPSEVTKPSSYKISGNVVSV